MNNEALAQRLHTIAHGGDRCAYGGINCSAWRKMSEELAAAASLAAPQDEAEPFQHRVQPWMLACFGEVIASDKEERNHRFLEEALELIQSFGMTRSEAHQLVDYTFNRPADPPQREVGGVMVTLAALCLAQGFDMHECGEAELSRVWTKIDVIRAKQAAKPKHSPLPEHVAAAKPSGAAFKAAEEIVAKTKCNEYRGGPHRTIMAADAVAAIIERYFPAAAAPDGPVNALRDASTLCRSGEGRPKVEIWFKDLHDAQEVHRWLAKLIASASVVTEEPTVAAPADNETGEN